jgi:hypothetical protein
MTYKDTNPTYNVNRNIVNFKDFDSEGEKSELKKMKRSYKKNELEIGQKERKYKYNKVTRKLDDMDKSEVVDKLEESNSHPDKDVVIQQLLNMLNWYVKEDDVQDWEGNEYWLAGKEMAEKAIKMANELGFKEEEIDDFGLDVEVSKDEEGYPKVSFRDSKLEESTKYEFYEEERKVIKNLKDLIHTSFFKGFSQGLLKGGERGKYWFDNIEFDLDKIDEMDRNQIDQFLNDVYEKSKLEVQKLNNKFELGKD